MTSENGSEGLSGSGVGGSGGEGGSGAPQGGGEGAPKKRRRRRGGGKGRGGNNAGQPGGVAGEAGGAEGATGEAAGGAVSGSEGVASSGGTEGGSGNNGGGHSGGGERRRSDSGPRSGGGGRGGERRSGGGRGGDRRSGGDRRDDRRGGSEGEQRDRVEQDDSGTAYREKRTDVDETKIDVNAAPGFKALGLSDAVMRGIVHAGFVDPTDIQAMLIPEIMAGHDVIGQAKTGTGKTAAFGLPFLNSADPNLPMQALILVPTRELAAQVSSELDMLGRFTPIRSTHIVGGESMRHQAKAIARGTQIIVGTPGRIMDMKERGEINFHNIKYAVLDEVDRMFDIGFREDIRKILKQVQTEHQTVFVSATMTEDVERLARTYMKPEAKKIVTFSGALTVKQVEQRYFSVEPWDKKQLLLHMLRKEKPAAAIIFCQTKANVHRVAEYLKGKGIDAREIHGDLAQAKRNKVMESMRDGNISVLVASDLAARGLDVEHISHVINYDLPEDPDIYVHRIGRTARAGRFGQAWSLVTSEQGQRLTEIEKLTGALVEHKTYDDFEPGTPPADVQISRDKQANRPDPMKTLTGRMEPSSSAFSEYTPEQLKVMFPDGKIPASLPKRTLGSRFKSHRK